MSPESGSREPVTKAGRRLYDAHRIHNIAQRVRADDKHDARWLRDILAIESEAVSRFAEALRTAVEELPRLAWVSDGMDGGGGNQPDGRYLDRAAVLSEIERLSQAPEEETR